MTNDKLMLGGGSGRVDALRSPSGASLIIYSPNSTWGIHMQTHGRTLSPQDAYANINVSSICNCNVACKTDVRCMAASCGSGGDGKLACYLADKGPTETSVINANGSHYIYRFDSLPAKHLGVKEDGLLYVVGNNGLNFADSQSWCEKIPGFRLAIFKTALQYPMAVQMAVDQGKQLWVDLKIVGTDMVWGDGTVYEDTDISDVARVTRHISRFGTSVAFRVRDGGGFDDRLQSRSHTPLCQANPRGIEW